MKWICVHCNKIMDCTNFLEFIKESDDSQAEYHSWKSLLETPAQTPETTTLATLATLATTIATTTTAATATAKD